MNLPWSSLEGPARLLVTCIAIMLVAGGLCGLQFLIVNADPENSGPLMSLFMVTGAAELVAMLVSTVLALGALIALIGKRITRD
ncbi:MAG TPA: hypothetical protein VK716_15400 [Terracidiphilus sp.]|nr:hypothetical protein [Terracidiphilus sp.]